MYRELRAGNRVSGTTHCADVGQGTQAAAGGSTTDDASSRAASEDGSDIMQDADSHWGGVFHGWGIRELDVAWCGLRGQAATIVLRALCVNDAVQVLHFGGAVVAGVGYWRVHRFDCVHAWNGCVADTGSVIQWHWPSFNACAVPVPVSQHQRNPPGPLAQRHPARLFPSPTRGLEPQLLDPRPAHVRCVP